MGHRQSLCPTFSSLFSSDLHLPSAFHSLLSFSAFHSLSPFSSFYLPFHLPSAFHSIFLLSSLPSVFHSLFLLSSLPCTVSFATDVLSLSPVAGSYRVFLPAFAGVCSCCEKGRGKSVTVVRRGAELRRWSEDVRAMPLIRDRSTRTCYRGEQSPQS